MTNRHRYRRTMRHHRPRRRTFAELLRAGPTSAEAFSAWTQPTVDEIHRRQLLYGDAWAEVFELTDRINTTIVGIELASLPQRWIAGLPD